MSWRRGRKRRAGRREPNGRPQRSPGTYVDPMAVALAAPHRRNAKDPRDVLLESPLGRLILRLGLNRNCFDAGLAYACLTRKVFSAHGIPQPHKDGHKAREDGLGLTAEVVEHLRGLLEKIDKRLKKAGRASMRELVLFEREICPEREKEAADALLELIA